jgi:3-oxoacyl-[acyl-carrier protein] reductase
VNYCSARAGVVTLTKCLALELAPKIKVNCVTPGWIETEEVVERYQLQVEENYRQAVAAVPLGKLGTPEDVSRMIEFLVCESTYITGQNFLVDGGKLMR